MILERIMIRKRLATVGPRAGIVFDLVQARHVPLVARDRYHLAAIVHRTLAHPLVAQLLVVEQIFAKLRGKIAIVKGAPKVALLVHDPNVISQIVARFAHLVTVLAREVLLLVFLLDVLLQL